MAAVAPNNERTAGSPRGRMLAAGVAAAFLVVGCRGGDAANAHRAATPDATRSPQRSLAVRADGTLDPGHIDLSGIAGVTPEEQASAEGLLRRTILTLPRWSDVHQATRDGFVPLGDSRSGLGHYVHWDWIEDDDIFDPSRPEALLYGLAPNGERVLEAAMFILPKRYTLENAPDVGGKLVQFHIHDKLCLTDGPAPTFVRLTRLDGTCTPPLVRRLTNAMTHVWIRPNPCGPFAEIAGLAAGAVKKGEAHACDRTHGAPDNL